MNCKTLLSRLGAALLVHYRERISSDDPDGLFEIDQGTHGRSEPFIRNSRSPFVQDTIRTTFAISCLTFLLHMVLGEGDIGVPDFSTVVIVVAVSAAMALL